MTGTFNPSTPFVALLVLAAVLAGCRSSDAPRVVGPEPVAAMPSVDAVLTGSFSSAAQAERDPEHYLDIRLHAVRIWPARTDGPWLYVEQAAASALDRPYRQRVYRLVQLDGGRVRSDVHTLPDPLRFAGWWASPTRFDTALHPRDLDLREGCSITVTADAVRLVWVGSTDGAGCESDLRGASYATSEVELFADRLLTWDRGFNDAGEQVWGATQGPYEFVRVD